MLSLVSNSVIVFNFYSLQVHARFWACSKSRNPGYCACGVAARDGDDVIVMDMCSGRFMETSVQISIKSNLPLAKGIRITEATSGKRYTVRLLTNIFKKEDFSVAIPCDTKPLCGNCFYEEPSLF